MGSPLKRSRTAGQDSSFLVRFKFRQNNSWQGELHWLDEDCKRNFRSALELIKLMLEAMEESDLPQADYELRTWKSGGSKDIAYADLCLSRQEEY